MAGMSQGLATGLETGLRLGMGMRDREVQQKERAEDREMRQQEFGLRKEESAERRDLARMQADDLKRNRELTRITTARTALKGQIEMLGKQVSGLAAQYGGHDKVPENVARPVIQQLRELEEFDKSLLAAMTGEDFLKMRGDAADLASNLQTGRVSLENTACRPSLSAR